MQSANAAKGTLYLTIQQLIQYLAAFIFYLGVARSITQAEVGLWSMLAVSTAVFATLTLLGLPVAAQKYVSESYGRGNLGEAASVSRLSFRVVALFTFPSLMITLMFCPYISASILGGSEYTIPLVSVLLASAILNFTALYGADMLGLGMYLEFAIQNLAFILTSKALGLALAYAGYGLLGLASGWLIGALSCLMLSVYLMRRKFPKPRKHLKELYGTVFRYSLPVWVLALITLAQGWADITILYALTGRAAVTGVYYLASAGATLLAIFWTAISTVILPLMSSEEARIGRQAVSSIYGTSSRLLNILVLPIGASLAAISPTAITIAYGPAYTEGAIPFGLLTATAILPAYVSINTSTLQAIAETKVLAKIGTASAVIDMALVAILVKPLGVNGAALARIGMFLTAFLLMQKTLAERAHARVDLTHLRKTIALAATVGLPLAALDYTLTNLHPINPIARLILEGILFLITYAVSLKRLKIVEIGDLDLLKKALPAELEKTVDRLGSFIANRTTPRKHSKI